MRGDGGDVVLEDLGSPHGTFVNGVRITTPARVTPGDVVMLGPATPLPWPAEAIPPGWTILTIGREPDNGFTLSLGSVSGYHARLIWNSSTRQATIEDLGSSNGTVLGSLEGKITRAALAPTDTVFLGSHPVPAAVLLARVTGAAVPPPPLTFRGPAMVVGRDPACDHVVDLPIVSGRHARLSRSGSVILIEDLGASNGTYVNGQRVERPVVVAAGDQIRLGTHALVLVVADANATGQEVLARTVVDAPRPPIASAQASTPSAINPATAPPPALPASPGSRRTPWPLIAVAALVPLGAALYFIISSGRAPGDRKAPDGPGASAPQIDSVQRPPAGLAERPDETAAPKRETLGERIATRSPVPPVAPSSPPNNSDLASRTTPVPPAPVPVPAPVERPSVSIEPPRPPLKPPSDQPPEPVLAWANSLDLSNLRPDEESRLGDELHAMVMAHVKPLEEGPLIERATAAARRVSDGDFTVTILDSNAVNAFSLPGGRIYVCAGLFDLIGSDEDYMLEFAIGHEIAHLTLKHALKFVAANAVEAKKRGVDTLNQFLVPIAMGYRNALEFEADAWIYRRMIAQPDSTKRMCLAFLRKFRDYAEREKFASGHKLPDTEFPLFANHYRAHPAARDRLMRLESFSANAAAAPAAK
jgi:pSer/pThr/pTyr-binding forkhead associated (FHA) protein